LTIILMLKVIVLSHLLKKFIILKNINLIYGMSNICPYMHISVDQVYNKYLNVTLKDRSESSQTLPNMQLGDIMHRAIK